MLESVHEASRAEPGRYLTFDVQGELYGIPILLVKEIIAVHPITPIPRLSKSIKGVINLRGRILPVVDLRLRLDLPERKHDRQTCIVVVDARWLIEDESSPIGVIVDAVSEVVHVGLDQIAAPPKPMQTVDPSLVVCLAKHPQRDSWITLLNMPAVLDRLEPEMDTATIGAATSSGGVR